MSEFKLYKILQKKADEISSAIYGEVSPDVWVGERGDFELENMRRWHIDQLCERWEKYVESIGGDFSRVRADDGFFYLADPIYGNYLRLPRDVADRALMLGWMP
jgi:hypothetical protein